MRRLSFFMFLMSCVLHATPFVSCTVSTPTQTTTVTGSSVCQLSAPPPVTSGVQAMAQAGDSIAGLQGTLPAETSAGISPAPSVPAGYDASAQADDSVQYATAGPARAGFIQLDVTTDSFRQLAPNVADASLTDGTHQYTYDANGTVSTPGTCSFGDICEYKATLPFD